MPDSRLSPEDTGNRHAYAQKKEGCFACCPMVLHNETDQEASQRGADDVAQIEQADLPAAFNRFVDEGMRDQWKGRSHQCGSDEYEYKAARHRFASIAIHLRGFRGPIRA